MTLPDGSHVIIGSQPYLLDEGYEQLVGRRCYVHGGRSVFAGRTDISGRPGAQNLAEDKLVWSMTDFTGEGQTVLDPNDDSSAFRFYRSEGLDFRTPGQMSLNKSILSETVSSSAGADVTKQGNADFTDVAGVSTTSGTDRILVDVGDAIGMTVDYPTVAAVGITQADFYIYRDDFSSFGTDIEGDDFERNQGAHAAISGTDLVFHAPGRYSSPAVSGLTGGETYRVEFRASTTSDFQQQQSLSCTVFDQTTSPDTIVTSQLVSMGPATPAVACALTFVAKGSHTYRFRIETYGLLGTLSADPITFDKATYGLDPGTNVATIEIYNQTAGTTVESKDIVIDATSADSKVGSVTFPTALATAYRARVSRSSGGETLTVDKVVLHPYSSVAWTLDCIDFGLGGLVWLAAHDAAGVADSSAWVYTPVSDTWVAKSTFNDGADTHDDTIRAMAHSDSLEFFLTSNNEVYSSNAAGTDDRVAYFSAETKTCVGMCMAQNRLWVLTEDSTSAAGDYVFSIPLDGTGTPYDLKPSAPNAAVRLLNIPTGAMGADVTFRQRMCGTPTGARFFVNYGDVTAKIYEVDGSGTTLEPRELADLGHGIRATSICYEAGITFVGAQYYGDASSSDSDKLPRAVLYVIDQNGAVQRIGFMRHDDPDPNPPIFMVPYQTHLYILQGKYIWRYDLVRGGLFLEYELNPKTAANQRALAVLFGSVFACYTDEVFVAGSVGTYRQSSVTDGSTYVSSINDFGLPFIRKSLLKIHVLADDMPTGARIIVEYMVDQNNTWVQAGEMSVGAEQTFYITDTSFTTMQVRARLVSVDGLTTPEVHAITVWCSSAQDEEYFDLVLLTEDYDSSFRIANDQSTGDVRGDHLVNTWRSKEVVTFRDGYASNDSDYTDYLVTIEDLRIEQNAAGEGRAVTTLKVIR